MQANLPSVLYLLSVFQSQLIGNVEDFVVPWLSPFGKELE